MRTFAALSLAALAAGCNLTNDTVLVAMLVQSPAPPAGLGVTVPQSTAASLYLGQTSVTSPSAGDVKPLSGATVQLYDNGALVTGAAFAEKQPGYYQATGDFYVQGDTYRFVARVGSDEYWGEIQGVPSAPTMTLTGTNVAGIYTYVSYATNLPSPFPIQRTCATVPCDAAFYGVWPVSGTTVSAAPSCTNAPQDGAALLQFAFLNDSAWRVPTFSAVKADCFPQPSVWPGAYLVGLTALKKGTTSGNTSIASAAYAGTSDAAGVMVSAP